MGGVSRGCVPTLGEALAGLLDAPGGGPWFNRSGSGPGAALQGVSRIQGRVLREALRGAADKARPRETLRRGLLSDVECGRRRARRLSRTRAGTQLRELRGLARGQSNCGGESAGVNSISGQGTRQ